MCKWCLPDPVRPALSECSAELREYDHYDVRGLLRAENSRNPAIYSHIEGICILFLCLYRGGA